MTDPANPAAGAGDGKPGEGANPAAGGDDAAAAAAAAAGTDTQTGGGDPAGGDAGAGAPQKPERPDYVPEKFWNAETGEARLEDFAKSYGELERERLERTKRVPEDYALPKGFEGFEDQIAAEQLSALKEAAKADGFSQVGFEGLVRALYGDPAAAKAELEKAFGDQLEPTLEACRKFASTLGDHENAVRMLCSTADGVKLLDAWRKASAGPGLPGQPGEGAGGRKTQEDLSKMMQDPRYWREKDPSFIEEVTRGFQELYKGDVQTAALNASGGA